MALKEINGIEQGGDTQGGAGLPLGGCCYIQFKGSKLFSIKQLLVMEKGN